jgi:hypothetical protein
MSGSGFNGPGLKNVSVSIPFCRPIGWRSQQPGDQMDKNNYDGQWHSDGDVSHWDL